MTRFEYKVVPAPKKGEKAKGVRTAEDRFALALSTLMNELGADGWEYIRADTLPAEEKSGWTSKTTVFQNMLVFRRAIEDDRPAQARPASVVPMERPAERRPAAEPAPAVSLRREDDATETTVVPVRRDAPEGTSPRLGPAST